MHPLELAGQHAIAALSRRTRVDRAGVRVVAVRVVLDRALGLGRLDLGDRGVDLDRLLDDLHDLALRAVRGPIGPRHVGRVRGLGLEDLPARGLLGIARSNAREDQDAENTQKLRHDVTPGALKSSPTTI